jgi:Fe-S oxidoreductase
MAIDKSIFEPYEQCMQDEPAACTARCPLHVDVRALAAACARGDFTEAFQALRKRVPLAGAFCLACEAPCEQACVRVPLDAAVSVHALERAAVEFGWAKPKRKLRAGRKNGRVAVVGGGASGLAAAFDLDGKGMAITVLESQGKVGGRLWEAADDAFTQDAVARELALLADTDIELHTGQRVGPAQLEELLQGFDAVLLACGHWDGLSAVNAQTFQASRAKLFACGSLLAHDGSLIGSAASGKRAAISVERMIKGASLLASREREGAFETPLRYRIDDAAPRMPNVAAGASYTREEAAGEASRCLQCSCDECLRACAHLRRFGRRPKAYGREIFTNENVFMGTRYANTMINSCTLCGLCAQRCPIGIGMPELVRAARRSMVAEGKMPPSAHDFALRDMEFSNSEAFFMFKGPPDGASAEWLFFPGCQLAASSPEHVQAAYAWLIESLAGGVGLALGCCGAPADWAGRDDLASEAAAQLRKAWQDLGAPKLICACPSCIDVLSRLVPEMPTQSLWELMAAHGLPPAAAQAQPPAAAQGRGGALRLEVHDACTARRNEGMQDSIRAIAASLGHAVGEMPYARAGTRCCGYGGLVFFANREQQADFAQHIAQSSGKDLLVYCAMCKDMLIASGRRAFHILDLLFAPDPEALALAPMPTLSARHANRARLKREMLQRHWGESWDGGADTAPWDGPKLYFEPGVLQSMENRLILMKDVEDVIGSALRGAAPVFRDTQDSTCLACLKKRHVTYWVRYRMDGEGLLVTGAYSHRMTIIG